MKGEVVHSWCLDVFLLSVLGIRQVDCEWLHGHATFATRVFFASFCMMGLSETETF